MINYVKFFIFFSQRYILIENYLQSDFLSYFFISFNKSINTSTIRYLFYKQDNELLKVLCYSIFNKLLDLKLHNLYGFNKFIKINGKDVMIVKKK